MRGDPPVPVEFPGHLVLVRRDRHLVHVGVEVTLVDAFQYALGGGKFRVQVVVDAGHYFVVEFGVRDHVVAGAGDGNQFTICSLQSVMGVRGVRGEGSEGSEGGERGVRVGGDHTVRAEINLYTIHECTLSTV